MNDNPDPNSPIHNSSHTIAIVSGKGGSGKTMVAVSIARWLARANKRVLLVDADFGTGGLTYYLTFKEFTTGRLGLSDAVTGRATVNELFEHAARPMSQADWGGMVRLISIGDQRRVNELRSLGVKDAIRSIKSAAAGDYDFVIVDCRGGLDADSLDVAEASDEVLMVVETDATSIRASQHLVDALSDGGLRYKIVGFILNKVMDDPTALARSGSSFFSSKYLGAVPFDIEATRCYIQGSVPQNGTLFSRHVAAIVSKTPFEIHEFTDVRILRDDEFGSVSLRDPRAIRGTSLIGMMTVYVILFYAGEKIWNYVPQDRLEYFDYAIFVSLIILLLGSLSERVRVQLGSVFEGYARFIRVIMRTNR